MLEKRPSGYEQDPKDPWAGTNWVRDHYNDDANPPKKEWPDPLKVNVNSSSPLEVDLFWSMRSPYCYLMLDRLLWLRSNYNVLINFRPIMPIAVRDPGFFDKSSVPWYRWEYDMVDQHRVAKFHGIPFRRPIPEPVTQDTYPLPEATLNIDKDQPNMWRVTRFAVAAQMEGKGLEFLHEVTRMMWNGTVDHWPEHVVEHVNRTGMDGAAIEKEIAANPDKFDTVWQENQAALHDTGHGGVPNMAFRGEPFFGEDRFDILSVRLVENGLTARATPIDPIVTRPRNLPRCFD